MTSPDPARRDPSLVREMFGGLVSDYDRLNRIMTLGQDRGWRRQLVRQVMKFSPHRVLDLAAGTGELSLLFQKTGVDVVAADFSEPMLTRAREKGVREIRLADALNLPFEDQSFDAVTIAWGFRNFSDRAAGSSEIYRVLKPGGVFAILESSEPEDWRRFAHRLYCRKIIPVLGSLLSGRPEAYQYLVNTVERFPKPKELARDLEGYGFTNTRWQTLGFGAVCLHISSKPTP